MTDPITDDPGWGPVRALADHPRARHKLRHVFDDRRVKISAPFPPVAR
jgi:hypothetical protein